MPLHVRYAVFLRGFTNKPNTRPLDLGPQISRTDTRVLHHSWSISQPIAFLDLYWMSVMLLIKDLMREKR
jgi:hypothetical protein